MILLSLITLLPLLALPAQDPVPKALGFFHESFDSVSSLKATQLIPLPGKGKLVLSPATDGGKRLEMRGETGFALPTPLASRMELSFDFEHGNGSGNFLLGNDRDPQHGFSKILSVTSAGGLKLTGHKSELLLQEQKTYRIALRLRWVTTKNLIVDRLEVRGPGLDVSLSCSTLFKGVKGAPLPFLHQGGTGSVFVDDLRIKVLAR